MARYQAEALYIASIYPGQLEAQMKYHGDSTDPREGRAKRYWIPPVPRLERPELPDEVKNVKITKAHGRWCAILEVCDAFENVPNPLKADGGRMHFDLSPVDCREIATNLHRYWGGNFVDLPAGATPGMMIIKGTVPNEDEMRQMVVQQQAFYEYRLMQGDKCARENNWKEFTQQMRDAVAYLGKERPWSGGMITTDCPACMEQIPSGASICSHCGTRLKALPKDIALLNPEVVVPVLG